MTSKITYLGDLRTSSEHIQSGNIIISDAPIDNHGKGEAFSPTDLLANSLGSCMMTIMAIKAQEMNIDLKGTTVEVTKIMKAEPRRVGRLEIEMYLPYQASSKEKIILERSAMNCPVFLSLHPDMEKIVSFHWK